MRKVRRISLVTMVATCLISGTLAAKSVSPMNPPIGVDIGGSVGGAHDDHLFGRDSARSERFRQSLMVRLVETLQLHNFKHDPDAMDYVVVGIWGHQIVRSGGQIENVYLIELSIRDHNYRDWAEAECEKDLEISHRAIGLASDSDLEKVLTSEALRLLEQGLPP